MTRARFVAFGFMIWIGSVNADIEFTPVKVEIRGDSDGYQLYRGGEPYVIRGAGTQIVADLDSLKKHGGNSIRTWDTGDGSVLDRAHELGLTVALCLNVVRERHGFNYDDPDAVRLQFEQMEAKVLRYRNHPALLAWIIGNELNFDYSNPRVYDAVNDISRMIHAHDPNHPTTTATAGLSKSLVKDISDRAPDLDFLSLQFYGGLFDLKKILEETGVRKPVMVTEWGTIGHWEVPTTEWGAPIEMNSSDKARTYQRGYEQVLAPLEGKVIGNYAFLWGHKLERTPTWYGTFTPGGRRTETVDVLQRIWTGNWPHQRAPVLNAMYLDGKEAIGNVRLPPGQVVAAGVEARAQGAGKVSYHWRLSKESDAKQVGGDAEQVPDDLTHLIINATGKSANFVTPQEPGPYRIYVYVRDEHGGAAHANIPFYVFDDQ